MGAPPLPVQILAEWSNAFDRGQREANPGFNAAENQFHLIEARYPCHNIQIRTDHVLRQHFDKPNDRYARRNILSATVPLVFIHPRSSAALCAGYAPGENEITPKPTVGMLNPPKLWLRVRREKR